MWGSGALRQAIFEYGGLVGGTFKATTGIMYLSYFIVSCGESDTVATVQQCTTTATHTAPAVWF